MSNRKQKPVESITIDFIHNKIVFKMTDDPAGRQIENMCKIMNLDERFQAINTRLSLNSADNSTQILEILKLSVMLQGIGLSDIDAERGEITFGCRNIFELFDVERIGEQ